MAQTKYTYSIVNDTANAKLAADSLDKEIRDSSIVTALDYVSSLGDTLDIFMKDSLSTGDETVLDGVVSAHDGIQLADDPEEIKVVEAPSVSPFAAKTLPNGQSLYRRVHGVKKTLSGDTTFDLVVPYNQCKINALEIVWAPAGLQVDLKVYDTPTGTISTVPNYMLNQFGFDAGIAKDYYAETSNYDADLIKDMKIEVTVKNPNSSTDEVCVNFILHEIK